MRGDSGVAGEGRVVCTPKFYSWGKCTMPLTNINSDCTSNASSGLCIILGYIIYAGPLSCILGCNYIFILHYIYILLHPCILGNRGGLKVINPSDKSLFMYFLINIYKITCIQYTCIHRSNIITHYSS